MSRGDIGLPEKKCSKCGEVKPLDDFYKQPGLTGARGADGRGGKCKECAKAYGQARRKRLGEKHRQRKMELYYENWERYRGYVDKDKVRAYNKMYRETHREEKYQRHKERLDNDVEYKLRHYTSVGIHRALTRNAGGKDGESVMKYLPYTTAELKEHIEKQFEPWMTWENHGRDGWHIDHIIPQSKLPYDSMSHPNFQKCWALENLQPLEAIENIKKGNRLYEREET